MRVIVTGSRDFADEAPIRRALASLPAGTVVVHGAQRGADALADRIARELGLAVEPHPADWQRYGKAAGPRRNVEMAEAGADLGFAFPLPGSVGTWHMVKVAREAGIPVKVHEHALEVWTARLPHHGCAGYTGRDRLDVTRGSGGDAGNPFAPSRPLLDEAQARKRRAKAHEPALAEAWDWYAPRYMDEMRASYRASRGAWLALLRREVVTVCCYCSGGKARRCHRFLLAEILVKLGAVYRGERA